MQGIIFLFTSFEVAENWGVAEKGAGNINVVQVLVFLFVSPLFLFLFLFLF